MAQVINSNVPSLTAQRNLNTSQAAQNTAIQRLSSGLRINSAKDDAAGLAISERMNAQIRGMNVAARNAQDGISLAQTAEGALSSIGNNLQRIRELSVQSANATNSAGDRAALQKEVTQLVQEIERVATNTEFNGTKLLDGSFSAQKFQVGANAGQTISVDSIMNASTDSMGKYNGVTGADLAVTADTATTLTLTDTAGNTSTINLGQGKDAKELAAAINKSGVSGLTATANATVVTGAAVTAGAAGTPQTVKINDVDVSFDGSAAAATTAQNAVDAINNNAQMKAQGIVATLDTDKVVLTRADGGAIKTDANAGFTAATATGTVDIDFATAEGVDKVAIAGGVTLATATVSAQGQFLKDLDISSADGAAKAIRSIDAALSNVNGSRADLGAIQNRFESVVSTLQTNGENLTASKSRIMDTDFAAETANLTRAQILQQAGTAMLAQANQLPQNVLSLLR